MILCHPLTDLNETFTQVRHWVSAKNLLPTSFPFHPKNMAWEKASNLRQLIEYGRQSKARNFETAEHVDKRLCFI